MNQQTQELYDARMKALNGDTANDARQREIDELKRKLKDEEDKHRDTEARLALLAQEKQQTQDALAAQQDQNVEITRLQKENDAMRGESQVWLCTLNII